MSECKICHQSWKPPRDIIFKDGMCIICYAIVNWLDEKDTNQKSIEEYFEV